MVFVDLLLVIFLTDNLVVHLDVCISSVFYVRSVIFSFDYFNALIFSLTHSFESVVSVTVFRSVVLDIRSLVCFSISSNGKYSISCA